MRIGISLLCAKRTRTGQENVAYNLIQNLAEVDQKNEYVIFTNNQSRDWFRLNSDRVDFVNVNLTAQRCIWLWEHLFFHLDSRSRGIDLLHFPQAGGVIGYRGKNVLTIHDLSGYLRLPHIKFREHLLYMAWYKANVSKANMIVTVSECVKNQVLENFPVSEDRIRVVYNGIDSRFKPMANSGSFKDRHGLPEKYILFVGSSYGNKNLIRLIEAFCSVRRECGLKHHLVLAGRHGDEHGKLEAFVKDNRLQNIVHLGGYFLDQDLPRLYSHASLFVFPTLTEGFGIPPLEAMACGAPVVASDIPVLREVLGDSAIWVDPLAVDSIAAGIKQVLSDVSLEHRLRGKGFERSKRFSCRRMAKDMRDTYLAALNSN